jgi:dTDP-glucose 4,6-dehydratase
MDSLLTGRAANIEDLRSSEAFSFTEGDVTEPIRIEGPIDWVFHLASPASPPDYLEYPIETLRVGSLGTFNALELASEKSASLLLASTSEVYGDPEMHPQVEDYWGNVNPVGPRSVYDEAKRFSEAAVMAYHRKRGLDVRIVRIFNTYGPGMRRDDGRAVPNFIIQALSGDPITVHGDGSQTRSLCYVDDLVEGIYRFTSASETGPLNLGNPEEVTVLELAERIRAAAGSESEIVFLERPQDDPERRRPDITKARGLLGWQPEVPLETGLQRTLEWARQRWVGTALK